MFLVHCTSALSAKLGKHAFHKTTLSPPYLGADAQTYCFT
jgi:hypothetical protein